MVAGGFQSINLAVAHVAECRERVPKAGVAVGEQPLQSVKSEAGADVRVFIDVAIVIEVDEIVTERLAYNDPDDRGQKDAARDDEPAVARWVGLRRSGSHF